MNAKRLQARLVLLISAFPADFRFLLLPRLSLLTLIVHSRSSELLFRPRSKKDGLKDDRLTQSFGDLCAMSKKQKSAGQVLPSTVLRSIRKTVISNTVIGFRRLQTTTCTVRKCVKFSESVRVTSFQINIT